ncbi:MAG: DUF624 domain-containing protein [Bacillota bacterium]|nr:DUF624 domain-containing protein [Bacillota bacterium]
MAGFLGFFDYNKPGPGVNRDTPPKPRFQLFFELFFRKFWNLIKLNLLFFVFNIPAIAAALFIAQFVMGNRTSGSALGDLYVLMVTAAVLVCIPIITLGPAQAGFTYVLRNYSREEHAFIWSDFKEHALRNLKQSLIIMAIDLVVTFVMCLDISVFAAIKDGGAVISFADAILLILFVLYMIMHMYIYPMLITFELKVTQIYKNALIFALLKLFPNLLILAICVLLVMISLFILPAGIILLPFITFSLIGFIINFHVNPILKKYMIDKVHTAPQNQEDKRRKKLTADVDRN